MHDDIMNQITITQAAVREADIAAARAFAQMSERAYGRADTLVLAERVLDVDSAARDALLAERAAYVRLLIMPTEMYADDRTTEVFALAGLDPLAGRAAFDATRQVVSTAMRDGIGTGQGQIGGVPLTVLEGREMDVRTAAAWLRARPASAAHWGLLGALIG